MIRNILLVVGLYGGGGVWGYCLAMTVKNQALSPAWPVLGVTLIIVGLLCVDWRKKPIEA